MDFNMQTEEQVDNSCEDSTVLAVSKVLKFAKLNIEDLKPCVQQLHFTRSLESDSIKLVEMNADILSHFENGGKFTIKGNSSDNCVLCTDAHTYEVKDAEISDSLLLVPGLQLNLPSAEVSTEAELSINKVFIEHGVSHNYLDLKPIKPKLNVVHDLLVPSKYNGPENEENITNKVTMADIFKEVCASDSEIAHALDLLGTINLDGYVRMIDFDYIHRVLNSITDLIDENSWHFDEFSRQETVDVLKDLYPQEIIEHILVRYGHPAPSSSSDNMWCLSEDKVCRFYAEVLLQSITKFSYTEFLGAWKETVPEGMITTLTQIRGLAFVDTSTESAVIRYFPESILSEDVKARFEQLFKAKDCWTIEELTPYIERLCVGKMKVGMIVTKYARAFNKNGCKYYTSKYTR